MNMQWNHSQKDRQLVFKTNNRLMQAKIIAEEHSAILFTFVKLSFVNKDICLVHF